MKKIVSLMLMIAMLLSVSAFADEEFTLHSGTKFGMSVDEVVKLEQEAGFDVRKSTLETDGFLQVKGKIAGHDDASANYYFTDSGALYRMYYRFSGDDYQAMENTLEKKYGATEYSSLTGMSLPMFTVNGHEYSDFNTGILYQSNDIKSTRLSCIYSQRIISISETEYVYIECKYTKSEFSTRLVENMWSTSTNESTIITYQLLDAETAEKIYSDLEQLNNDL